MNNRTKLLSTAQKDAFVDLLTNSEEAHIKLSQKGLIKKLEEKLLGMQSICKCFPRMTGCEYAKKWI